MTQFKSIFTAGKMNQDIDSRLLPEGEYREALNFSPLTSAADSAGAMENSLSTKRLTAVDLGTGPYYTLGMYADTSRDKVYWFVKSATGSYVVEYDTISGITTMVLEDTTAGVLNFDENYLITGVAVIYDSDNEVSLMAWTDNLNPIRLINIDRAKAYGANNFVEADVSLIKAPPLSAPTMVLANTPSDSENNISERFIRFAYRYKYLDGEYSAFSPFTETAFSPNNFSYDYATSSNESMVNQFNQVDLTFNTGPKQVVEIDLLLKESGSNTVYIIDSINKSKNSYLDNTEESFTFINNQLYRALADDQLARLYDAVPNKAKALEVIGKRLVLGNYTENQNIANEFGPIKIDYAVSLVSTATTEGIATKTLKSNRDYEIGLVYMDDFGRQTTVLNSTNNTVFIPNANSITGNKLKVQINSLPPTWATKYKFYIKQSKTDYETIVPSNFYQDGVYVWVKVEGNETQKFDEGDFIYIKSDSTQLLPKAIQTRVLEVVDQPENFLEDEAPVPYEVLQQSGKYFKIKPSGFRLNEEDFVTYEYVSYGFRSSATSNNFINDTTSYIEPAVYYGSTGVNDMTASGTYSGSTDIRYLIDINAVGPTDSFRWSNDDGLSYSADIPITGAAQTIENGLQVTFTNTTGHSLDDSWIVSAKSSAVTIAVRENSAGSAAGTNARRAIITYGGKPSSGPGGETILGGAQITIVYNDTDSDGAAPGIDYTQTFLASKTYANIEEWFFGDNVINTLTYPTTLDRVIFRRGVPTKNQGDGFQQVTIDTSAEQIIMCFMSNEAYNGSEQIKVNRFSTPSLSILELKNNIVFETIPVNDNSDIYFETSSTYSITGGYHLGTGTDVNQSSGVPAQITLPTFNGFSWGNGFESYKIKDLFNARSLKLDTRPSGAINDYRKNVRIADLTYSKGYDQSTNVNGLNEFNLSTANFKPMDDRYQSIQKLYSEDTNLIVYQEDKIHNVPFQKDILFDADGNGTLRESTNVLGTASPYTGEYGISKNPESFAVYGNRKYNTDVRRGAVMRLSTDGLTDVSINGMSDFFDDNFRDNPNTKKLGCYDLHEDQYILHLDDGDKTELTTVPCGAFLNLYEISDPVVYTLLTNDSGQPVTVNYSAGAGTVLIEVNDGFATNSSGNVTGSGSFQFSKTSDTIRELTVTITAISALPSLSINIPCPVDLVVANNESASVFQGSSVNTNVLFNDIFATAVTVTIISQGTYGTATVQPDKTITYSHAGANALPDSYTYQINDGSSTDTAVVSITVNVLVANADSAQVFEQGSTNINVLANDVYDPNNVPTPTITVQGTSGTAVVQIDKSITYTHSTGTVDDSFTYQISSGGSVDTAVVAMDVIPNTGGGGGATGTSFSMSGTGNTDPETSCGFSLTQTKFHDGDSVYPTLADNVYNDVNKSTTFNGSNLYWAIANGRSIQISPAGVILDLYICGAGSA